MSTSPYTGGENGVPVVTSSGSGEHVFSGSTKHSMSAQSVFASATHTTCSVTAPAFPTTHTSTVVMTRKQKRSIAAVVVVAFGGKL